MAAKQLLARTPLRPYLTALKVTEILERQYGHFRSSRNWAAVDGQGDPIPWYTYPAISFLQQLDLHDRLVFEYGSGNSTHFWARRVRQVHAVEDDGGWHAKVQATMPGNVTLQLVTSRSEYVESVHQLADPPDIIAIDGSHRGACAREAVKRLAPGGAILLDNADWFVKTAAFLRSADLIEVDFTGFTPINAYTATTSLFLHREFRASPAAAHQPAHGVGGLKQYGADDF